MQTVYFQSNNDLRAKQQNVQKIMKLIVVFVVVCRSTTIACRVRLGRELARWTRKYVKQGLLSSKEIGINRTKIPTTQNVRKLYFGDTYCQHILLLSY